MSNFVPFSTFLYFIRNNRLNSVAKIAKNRQKQYFSRFFRVGTYKNGTLGAKKTCIRWLKPEYRSKKKAKKKSYLFSPYSFSGVSVIGISLPSTEQTPVILSGLGSRLIIT